MEVVTGLERRRRCHCSTFSPSRHHSRSTSSVSGTSAACGVGSRRWMQPA